MKGLRKVSRWVTGLVFIFSGFVKGVDPLGTAYKLEDYFAAYGLEWANSFALELSVLLCSLEFMLGIALIMKLLPKLTSRLLMLMMVFFTLLTFYDAIYAPVPDCGCFGDAIKLTNWQTFYKNLVLMVFVLLIYFDRKNMKCRPSTGHHLLLMLFVLLGFAGFSICNYRHLPLLDFMDWKEGNNMVADQSQAEVHLTYRNIHSGELKDYISPNYPWNDSAWLADWEFVDQKFVTDQPTIAHNLHVEDEAGNDFTSYVLESETMAVIVAYDLTAVSTRGQQHLDRLLSMLEAKSTPHLMLTASLPDGVALWKQKNRSQTEVFFADATVLKTMIRSNPGLILLSEGIVLKKWHHNDFPDAEDFGKLLTNIQQHP